MTGRNGCPLREEVPIECLATARATSNSPVTNDAISFSIVRRKVLTPTDFATRTALEHYLLAFQHRYQALTQPFRCILIRAGRQRLLAELAAMGAGRMTEDTSP